MSYARYAAAAADVEALSGGTRLQWKLRQAQAELRASLPFLGDDIFVLIAAELDARMLGRLACTAPRFWRASVPDPAHKGKGKRAPELWSVAEEGARRRLAAQSEQVRGWVSRETSGGSWLRALGKAEKLQAPLRFAAHGPRVELSVFCSVELSAGGECFAPANAWRCRSHCARAIPQPPSRRRTATAGATRCAAAGMR
eukprot:COSAG04_NODE_3133_length_3132_cov_13.857567_1_plen_199_part_00